MLLLLLLKIISSTDAAHVELLTPGSSISSVIPLPSDPAPDFSGPIQNVTVAVGREAILSCSVTDLGHYKVGWMKADDQTILSLHTRVITHNPRITVTHDDDLRTWQLHIRQLKETDRGCYMCQINTSSMKKTLGCVDVQVPPDIDDEETSGDITAKEGDNATLVCKATGHPDPRILWRREDGSHIILHPKPHDTDIVDTFSGASLALIRLERRQMGAYLCIASNDVPPAVSKRITLNINFPPTVQYYKNTVGAPLGSNVKLKCDVEAFPNSNNYWRKDQGESLLNGPKYIIQERKNSYKLTMVLTILNITQYDYGHYMCGASNSLGKSDATINLYEIKIPTTTTTSTTTTTEPVYIVETTTPKPAIIPRSTTPQHTMEILDEDPSENWLFPSVAPAPLELETYSSANPASQYSVKILLTVLVFIFR